MNEDTTTNEQQEFDFEAAAPGWTGRADYAERREARLERLQDRAERHDAAAHAAFQRAHAAIDGIPFGQPNINGCLTPAINRHDAAMRVAVREHEAAEEAEARAKAAAGNTAISSDNPEALSLLRKKLEKLEALQERMKAVNAALRIKDTAQGDAKLIEMGYDAEGIAELRTPDFIGRVGFPNYALSNNNATIRTVKARIAELEARANGPAPEGWTFEGGEVVCNVAENRLQVRFDAIPPEETRASLKLNGFRWSRWAGVWQRQLTPQAIRRAGYLFPKTAKEA